MMALFWVPYISGAELHQTHKGTDNLPYGFQGSLGERWRLGKSFPRMVAYASRV